MNSKYFVMQYARICGTSTFQKKELCIQNPNRDGENELAEILTKLVKKRYLVRIKNGLYAINRKQFFDI